MKKLTVSMTRQETTWGWIYFALQMTVLQLFLSVINSIFGSPLSFTGMNAVYFVVNFVCSIVIFHKFLKDSARVAFRNLLRCVGCAGIGLITYYFSSVVVAMLTQWIYPGFSNINDATIVTMVWERPVLISMGVVLLVPVTEELVFRGLIFRPLYNRAPWLGYVVSSACFSMLHILPYIGQCDLVFLLLCFIQYIPAGLCIGWAYARSQSIWSSVLIHTAVNLIGVLVMM